MKCPKCDSEDTRVLESRVSHEGRSVRRRRLCTSCNHRFTTFEKEEELTFQIKKKDNRFEEFSREKITKSISTACLKRQIPIDQIETLIAGIETQLRSDGERVVQSKKIGDLVMEKLKHTDHVAYVRFASIYKDFKDPEEFVAELKKLKNESEGSIDVHRTRRKDLNHIQDL